MKKEEPKKPDLKVKETKKDPEVKEVKGGSVPYAKVDESPLSKSPTYTSPLPPTAHPMAEHYVKEFILAERDLLGLKEFVNELPTERRAAKHPTLLKYFNLYSQYADK